MNRVWVIVQRELGAMWRSPLAVLVIAIGLLVEGVLFYSNALREQLVSAEVLERFFYDASGVTLMASVALSMRLIAEERQTGTITLYNTAPLGAGSVVFGKYLATLTILGLFTLLSGYMPALVWIHGKVSIGQLCVGLLGLLLLASATCAIGLFASTLVRSQVAAALLASAFTGVLLLGWVLARSMDPPFNDFFARLALHHMNFRPFMRGTLDLGAVAYYLAVTSTFLLASTQILEVRRWR